MFSFPYYYHFFTGLDCIYEQHSECIIRSKYCLLFTSNWVYPRFFCGVRVALFYSLFLCYPIMCLYVMGCVLWYPFRVKTMVGSHLPCCLQARSCRMYVICVCLHIVVFNTYCVVLLFCFSLYHVPYMYIASFSEVLISLSPFSNLYLS